MTRDVLAIGLIGITLILISCQSQPVDTLTITHYSLTNESVRLVQGLPSPQPISISVDHEGTDENNEVSSVTLANGQLVDGELKLEQKITEPTEVVISVKFVTDDVNRETTAVLRPDAQVEFVVIHKVSPYAKHYSLLLKGNDHRSLNKNLKFSIKGDLSQLHNFNPDLVQVRLVSEPSFFDGSGKPIEFDPVLVDEGEFSIEGDLDEPALFRIEMTQAPAIYFGPVEFISAILEPGVNYSVVPSGNRGKYAVLADRESLHTQLVSSWQLDPELVTLVDTFLDDVLDARWGMEREAHEEHMKELIGNYPVAEQCDHVSLTDEVKSRFVEPYKYSYQKTADLIGRARSEALRKILRDNQDPDLARMIFELSWIQFQNFGYDAVEKDYKVALEELALKMDEEFVDQFITPRVDSLRNMVMLEKRNSSLLPGHVAPKFTWKTIAGDEVSLSEVLSENELVLLDFWTSSCDSCIASFSALKEIYAEYKDQGFEIVTISIDENLAEWESASDELDLPWINLGDTEGRVMKGGISPTRVDFGVSSIPNKFLIDKRGCIVHKRFSEYKLKEMLTSLKNANFN